MNVGATEVRPYSASDVSTDEVTPGILRVTGIFAPVASGVDELITGGSSVSFQMSKFVNTLELPSWNFFYVTLGQVVSGTHYSIASYKFLISMVQAAELKMKLTPLTLDATKASLTNCETADKDAVTGDCIIDRRVGDVVQLQVEYEIAQVI